MKLRRKDPVEQLDDERLTNIERRIVAGAADAAMRAQAPRLRGVVVSGRSRRGRGPGGRGRTRHRLEARHVPHAGARSSARQKPMRVDTTAERAQLDIGDARIESNPVTVFAVTRPDGGVLVEMTRGKVELDVDKRGERIPWSCARAIRTSIVVGTHFTVDCGAGLCSAGEVDVRVTEGVVEVVRRSQPKAGVRVAAGQTWKTKRGLLALAEAQAADAERVASADTTKVPGGSRFHSVTALTC